MTVRNSALLSLVGLALLAGAGCGARTEKIGGETNWLAACSDDDECTNSQCLCGVCSRHCERDRDCNGVGDSVCLIEGNASQLCGEEHFASACVPTKALDTADGSTPTATNGPVEPGPNGEFTLDLPAGGQGFEGEIVFDGECNSSWVDFLPSARLQLILTPNRAAANGVGWGLPATESAAELTLVPAQGELSGTNLVWLSSLEIPEFRFTDLKLTDDGLTGKLARATAHQTYEDTWDSCDRTGTITLKRDTTAPELVAPQSAITGFAPLVLTFSEPVARDFTFGLAGLPTQFVRQDRSVNDDFVAAVTITPTTPWPSGSLSLEFGPLTDGSGQVQSSLTIPLAAPEYTSATSNLSFEEPLADDGPWFGSSCTIEPSGSGFDYEALERVQIPPSDGDSLLACSGAGLLLQGYIEPPSGSTQLLLDLFEENGAPSDVTVTLRFPNRDQVLPLPPGVDSLSTPALGTYRADLATDEPFWLLIEQAFVFGAEGDPIPRGRFIVDHLRFE